MFRVVLIAGLLNAIQASSSCGNSRYFLLTDGWCYSIYNEPMANYDEAEKICQNDGGHLTSVHNAVVNRYLASYDADGLLIGLRYNYDTSEYEWSDGTPQNFIRYANGFEKDRYYNGDCVKSIKTLWYNAECEKEKLKFLCRKKAISQLIPKATQSCPNSSLLYTDGGTLYSPGYPEQYDLSNVDQRECVYKLAVRSGNSIVLRFEEMSLENDEGYIYVYRDWNDKYEFAQVSNIYHGLQILVDNNRVLLRLIGSIKGKWQIAWSVKKEAYPVTEANECPDQTWIYPVPGLIYSPGYPARSTLASGWSCEYKIAAKEKHIVQFSINASSNSATLYFFGHWNASYSNQEATIASVGQTALIHSKHILMRVYNINNGFFLLNTTSVLDD